MIFERQQKVGEEKEGMREDKIGSEETTKQAEFCLDKIRRGG